MILMVVMVRGFTEAKETIYDVLKKNALPDGLFPMGVKSYSLNDDDQLEVYVEKPCYSKFENEVYFERMIRGKEEVRKLSAPPPLSRSLQSRSPHHINRYCKY